MGSLIDGYIVKTLLIHCGWNSGVAAFRIKTAKITMRYKMMQKYKKTTKNLPNCVWRSHTFILTVNVVSNHQSACSTMPGRPRCFGLRNVLSTVNKSHGHLGPCSESAVALNIYTIKLLQKHFIKHTRPHASHVHCSFMDMESANGHAPRGLKVHNNLNKLCLSVTPVLGRAKWKTHYG